MYMSLIKLIAEKQNPDWECVHTVIGEAVARLKALDPDCYATTMDKLGKMAYCISEDKAREIVRSMRPYGEKWTIDTVTDFARSKGILEGFTEWYLTMNMAYNDYHGTGAMVGLAEDTEFYYSLAREFITDEDGKKFKVEKYFLS